MKLKLKILVGISLASLVVIVASVVLGATIFVKRNLDAQMESKSGIGQGKLDSALGQVLSATDVATHSTSADCWIIIDGGIYAVTNFLNSHPGGSFTITPYCGKDATNAFQTKDKNPSTPHSKLAIDMLAQYFVAKIGQQIQALPTPSPVAVATPSPIPSAKPVAVVSTLSVVNVATHNTGSDCWIIVSNNVYAVTSFLNSHPGGAFTITPYCGKDATNAYGTKDKNPGSPHSGTANSMLAGYLVGKLGSAAPVSLPMPPPAVAPVVAPVILPTPSSQALSMASIATHNTTADCWLIVSNNVYNVSGYLASHPGGVSIIQIYCGKEATNAFQTKGGRGGNHSSNASNQLSRYLIGSVGSTVSNPAPSPSSSGACVNVPAAVCSKYPDAVLIEGSGEEDDGQVELKVSTGGSCRDINLNSSGEIRSDKAC